MSQSRTFSRAKIIALSVAVPAGSAFKRTDPERMNGSCGMVIRRERIVSRRMTCKFSPSMLREPELISMIRRSIDSSEDLPLA